jgi:HEAT repeat protein
MNARRLAPAPLLAALVFAAGVGRLAAADQPPDPDARLLEKAGLGADDAALVDYLRAHAAPGAEGPDRLASRLGSDSFEERERACRRLVELGAAALPALRRAAEDPDLETSLRAKACLQRVRRPDATWRWAAAVVRRTLRRRPPGGAEALLAYLPDAADAEGAEDIAFGLDAWAADDAKVREALAAALSDRAPARRAVAACVLAHRGDAGQRAAAAKLVEDADPVVRLRAAQGLLAAKDQGAVPPLVALLGEESAAVAWQAEELLHYTAGDDAPDAVVGAGGAKERGACRAAWEGWWKARGDKLDLSALDREARRPGLFLVCCTTAEEGEDVRRVRLYGCDGKPRWTLPDVCSATDAHWLPGGRFVVAEIGYHTENSRVSERDLAGKVEWEAPLPHAPEVARRLPDGGAFVVDDRTVREIDTDGRTVVLYGHGSYRVRGAGRTDDGRYVLLDDIGMLWDVDPANDYALKRRLGWDWWDQQISGFEVLPDGHCLATRSRVPEVREVDREGRAVWSRRLPGAGRPSRLRNGETLIADGDSNRLIEIDPGGALVWEALLAERPERARPLLGLVSLGFGRAKGVEVDPISVRIHALKGEDAALRRRAAADLADFGNRAGDAVPALAAALRDPDAEVREAAVGALEAIGTPAAAAVPALVAALSDRDESPRVRRRAEAALVAVGKAATPALREALRADDPQVRAGAVHALGRLAVKDAAAAPGLIAALKDPEGSVRRVAAEALRDVLGDVDGALPPLLEALTDPDVEVRRAAAASLRAAAGHRRITGPDEATAAAELYKAMKDEDEGVRTRADGALAKLGLTEGYVVRALVKRLKGGGAADRAAAAEALGRLGADARAAASALAEAAADPDEAVRQAARKALEKVKP